MKLHDRHWVVQWESNWFCVVRQFWRPREYSYSDGPYSREMAIQQCDAMNRALESQIELKEVISDFGIVSAARDGGFVK